MAYAARDVGVDGALPPVEQSPLDWQELGRQLALAEAKHGQTIDAEKQLKSVEASYRAGDAPLNILIEATRRRTDAAAAYQESLRLLRRTAANEESRASIDDESHLSQLRLYEQGVSDAVQLLLRITSKEHSTEDAAQVAEHLAKMHELLREHGGRAKPSAGQPSENPAARSGR